MKINFNRHPVRLNIQIADVSCYDSAITRGTDFVTEHVCMYKHVDAGFLEDSTCDPCEFLVQLLDAQPSGSGLIPSMSRVSYYKGKNPYLFF